MSLLPEPSTFEKRYSDDEKLASELPDRPITSPAISSTSTGVYTRLQPPEVASTQPT